MAKKCDDFITHTVTHSITGSVYKAVMLAIKIERKFWCQLTHYQAT